MQIEDFILENRKYFNFSEIERALGFKKRRIKTCIDNRGKFTNEEEKKLKYFFENMVQNFESK